MVYREKFYVGFSDVSSDMGILNSAILKLFENACCLQGESVGDGFYDSPGRWFLTAYKVNVIKRPVYGRHVEVGTWSRGMKGVAASREFEITLDGETLVTALSNWARFNVSTGKLERMDEALFERYESEPERTNFGEMWLTKLKNAPEGGFKMPFMVGRNLIDANMHMNNVRYLDLAAEAVYESGISGSPAEPDSFEITYRKAFGLGEKGVISVARDGEAVTAAFLSEDEGEVRAVVRMG